MGEENLCRGVLKRDTSIEGNQTETLIEGNRIGQLQLRGVSSKNARKSAGSFRLRLSSTPKRQVFNEGDGGTSECMVFGRHKKLRMSCKRALRANWSSTAAGEPPQKCKPLYSADTKSSTLRPVAAEPCANTVASVFAS